MDLPHLLISYGFRKVAIRFRLSISHRKFEMLQNSRLSSSQLPN